MAANVIATAAEELYSAEYVMNMVDGIAGLLQDAADGKSENRDAVAWAASAVRYLLDDAKECLNKSRRAMQEATA